MQCLVRERRQFREVLHLFARDRDADAKTDGVADVEATSQDAASAKNSTEQRAALFDEPGIDRASLDLVLRAFAEEVQGIRREDAFTGSADDVSLLARSLAGPIGLVAEDINTNGKITFGSRRGSL